ncbi:hypothetical protein EDB82DRAFT_45689 [Fusarium venenatum]|uniref:uncharacterized protein n=1 Tax=Fusarium venenatum TaxID=56646 RepID=UPI001DAB0377|nr:hypothetical protein EDB82DRAFT_45689 [Fusarium venenatum]
MRNLARKIIILTSLTIVSFLHSIYPSIALNKMIIFQHFDPRFGPTFPVHLLPPTIDEAGYKAFQNLEFHAHQTMMMLLADRVKELTVSFLFDANDVLKELKWT